MKAVAVFPGKPNTVHLAELAQPTVREIPNGRGVLVKVLRVGVDGTDKEINAAEYGAAPEGFDAALCVFARNQVDQLSSRFAQRRKGAPRR